MLCTSAISCSVVNNEFFLDTVELVGLMKRKIQQGQRKMNAIFLLESLTDHFSKLISLVPFSNEQDLEKSGVDVQPRSMNSKHKLGKLTNVNVAKKEKQSDKKSLASNLVRKAEELKVHPKNVVCEISKGSHSESKLTTDKKISSKPSESKPKNFEKPESVLVKSSSKATKKSIAKNTEEKSNDSKKADSDHLEKVANEALSVKKLAKISTPKESVDNSVKKPIDQTKIKDKKLEKVTKNVLSIEQTTNSISDECSSKRTTQKDFSRVTTLKKLPSNPSHALQKILAHKEKISSLEPEIRVAIERDEAWERAHLQAKGVSLKDNPELLKKAIKKKQKRKEKSKENWAERKKQVQISIEEKQQKRAENIKKRKGKKSK